MARKQSNPRKSSPPGRPRQGGETMSAHIGPLQWRDTPSTRKRLKQLADAGWDLSQSQNEVARRIVSRVLNGEGHDVAEEIAGILEPQKGKQR